ncbi:MAG: hypothetical protein SOZ59_12840 [Candidatus Limivivens sp.]|nr:hypothetical protein [Candidatus Limivivens sp.]
MASSTDDNAADNEIDGAFYHKLQVVSTLGLQDPAKHERIANVFVDFESA